MRLRRSKPKASKPEPTSVKLIGSGSGNPVVRWLIQRALPLAARSWVFPIVQRRLFFGAPLPPLDPAFRFEA